MEKMIKRLYDLMYSPIVTPWNLVENAKLDNYEYVNYSKSGNGLVVSMKCKLGDCRAIFNYHFDQNDALQIIKTAYEDGTVETVFDRQVETDQLRKGISESLQRPFACQAV